MQIPSSPPEPSEFLPLIQGPEQLAQLVQGGLRAEQDGRYLHWDELRRRKPPSGWSTELWWVATSLARTSLRKELPFRSSDGKPFWFARTDGLERGLHDIDRRMGSRLEVTEPSLANPEERDRYILRSLVEEAITSSQLEGAATTRSVAKEMLLSGRTPRTRDERMILNNFRAMSVIREWRDEELTPERLLELHRVLTEDTLEPQDVGRFRRRDEPVTVQDHASGQVLHVPPDAAALEARITALCEFANERSADAEVFIHPVVRAVLLHLMLGYDHPFVDGNGRTARAIFYWCLLRQGYWMAEFLSISRVIQKAPGRYARAFLYTETDHFDATYFVLHEVGVIQEAITDLYSYLEDKSRELRQAERLLKSDGRFNHRQRVLLGHALRHPRAEYTIEAYRREHGIVYQTARTDLLALERAGFLVRRQEGKAFVFHPGPALRRRR